MSEKNWVGVPIKEKHNPCKRCGGTGVFVLYVKNDSPVLSPHDAGICWDCGGSGRADDAIKNKRKKAEEGGYYQPSFFDGEQAESGSKNSNKEAIEMTKDPILETKVRVGNAERDVKVLDVQENFICGFIGTRGWFEWNTGRYDLPKVKIKGRKGKYKDKDRQLAAAFVRPVIQELQEGGESKSPEHGNGSGSSEYDPDKERSTSDKYLSGVPYWMYLLKEQVPKYRRKEGMPEPVGTFLGYAKAKYPKDKLPLVREFLSYCERCIFRAKCMEPCNNKKENSAKKIL